MQHLPWLAPIVIIAAIAILEIAALIFSRRTLKIYVFLSAFIIIFAVWGPFASLPSTIRHRCAQSVTTDTLLRCKASSAIQPVAQLLFNRNNISIGTVSWAFLALAMVLLYRQLRTLNSRNDLPTIEVGEFPDVTPQYATPTANIPSGYVPAQLRAILARSLTASAQVPGPRVPVTTSALLEGVSTLDTGAFGKVVAFALNWISPSRRWRLEGTTFGNATSQCGVYVNLLDLATDRSVVAATFWADSWDSIIQDVAYYIIATAFRQSNVDPPYLRWRDPNGRGLRAYHQWQRATDDLDFGAEIQLLTQACSFEPANVLPRLEMAYRYERLASSEEQAAASAPAGGPVLEQSYAHRLQACAIYAALSARHPRLLQARYRLAVTLGNVDRWKAAIRACPDEWHNLAQDLGNYLDQMPLRHRVRYFLKPTLGSDGHRHNVRRHLMAYLPGSGSRLSNPSTMGTTGAIGQYALDNDAIDEIVELLRVVGTFERLSILRDCSIPILAMWCLRLPYRRLYGTWLRPFSSSRLRAAATVRTSLAVVEAGRIWRSAQGLSDSISRVMIHRRWLQWRIYVAVRRGRKSGLPAYNAACFYAYLIGRLPACARTAPEYAHWVTSTLPWARQAVKYLDMAVRNIQEPFLPWEWVDVVDTDFERLRQHEYYLHWRRQMAAPMGSTLARVQEGVLF